MSVTAKIRSFVEITIGGEQKTLGSLSTPVEMVVDGECFEVIKKITNAADPNDYNRQLMWQDGDGGLSNFDILAVVSDVDVLLELTIDRAGTPSYATIGLEANVPFILSTDDLLDAITVDGTATTMDQIDQISIQNNNSGTSTATVRLLLLS